MSALAEGNVCDSQYPYHPSLMLRNSSWLSSSFSIAKMCTLFSNKRACVSYVIVFVPSSCADKSGSAWKLFLCYILPPSIRCFIMQGLLVVYVCSSDSANCSSEICRSLVITIPFLPTELCNAEELYSHGTERKVSVVVSCQSLAEALLVPIPV